MKLSDLRIELKLTQEEVAKNTGIPYNTYRRYEYGETFPSARAVCALARLYAVAPGALFESLCHEWGLIP